MQNNQVEWLAVIGIDLFPHLTVRNPKISSETMVAALHPNDDVSSIDQLLYPVCKQRMAQSSTLKSLQWNRGRLINDFNTQIMLFVLL